MYIYVHVDIYLSSKFFAYNILHTHRTSNEFVIYPTNINFVTSSCLQTFVVYSLVQEVLNMIATKPSDGLRLIFRYTARSTIYSTMAITIFSFYNSYSSSELLYQYYKNSLEIRTIYASLTNHRLPHIKFHSNQI